MKTFGYRKSSPLAVILACMLLILTKQGDAAISTSNATVKIQFDKKAYYPGQTMKINVTRIDTNLSKSLNGPMQIVIAPANATSLYSDEYNVWHDAYWNTSAKTTIFNITFLQYQNGLYKVGVMKGPSCCSWNFLGISEDMVRIYNPLLSIKLPKKQFYQGEAVQLNIYNPYINLTYQPNDVTSYPPGYDRHRFKIVSTYPSVYEKPIDMITSRTSKSLIVPYEQDEYKIILIREAYSHSGVVGVLVDTTYISDVANSTFRVIRNYPMLTAGSRCDGKNETILVSLTTTNNIPLMGPYTVEVVSKYDVLGTSYVTKRMKQMFRPTASLNTTIPIVSGIVDFRIRIVLDYSIWALSTPFYAGLCNM